MSSTSTAVGQEIVLDHRGVAYVKGTRTKVIHVVLNKELSSETVQELQQNMPHLSVQQIEAALAYYAQHKLVLDDYIRRSSAEAERMRAEQPIQFTKEELLARAAAKGIKLGGE